MRNLHLILGRKDSVSNLISYTDSDYANDPSPMGQCSVGGYCFSLGSGLVSWSFKKQQTVADSTCTTEYIAASEAGHKLVWLCKLLSSLGFYSLHTTPLLCNNTAAILLCEDQAYHSCVKHINICYHWIYKQVKTQKLTVVHIGSQDNNADIFTKALASPAFQQLWGYLGLCAQGE